MEPWRRHAQPDALSSLPAELLDDILTRLDLRDAVRTSALSRAWRRRWESLTALSLSLLHHHHPGTLPLVVASVLLRHAARISRLCVKGDPQSTWHRLHNRRDLFRLHSSFFSCVHLVSLELQKCQFPPLPAGFAGFPLLQEMNLTNVRFVGDGEEQVEAIIRQSPLLEVLKLSYVLISTDESEADEWVIQGPNLRSLTIRSKDYQGWQFGELPRLSDATIDLVSYVDEHDFGEFLAGVGHVGKLTIAAGYLPEVYLNKSSNRDPPMHIVGKVLSLLLLDLLCLEDTV
ncbi:hypothetical protein PR202_gb22492 [Eleusine coracana subsp. coracana]|uniref:F-box domain-containing protein n=1 Tax=Eleusine coracana subsp. coracana TaxID=191504 RepID=A0AAV5FHF7_ELECO|nr:hypothetical protein PR202_gb22492 [Eleusine coracana subsp. coracana]